MKNDLIYPKRSYEIVGACFEVYKEVGCGFTEPVYQACLEKELEFREIPHISQPRLKYFYKGIDTGKHFVPDFICFDLIILEIKALQKLDRHCVAQTLNYLNATKLKLGILANFGSISQLDYKRLANTQNEQK